MAIIKTILMLLLIGFNFFAKADTDWQNLILYRVPVSSTKKDFKHIKITSTRAQQTLGDIPKAYQAKLKGGLIVLPFQTSYHPVSQATLDSDRQSSFVVDYSEEVFNTLRKKIIKKHGSSPSFSDLESYVYQHIKHKKMEKGFDLASSVAQDQTGDCTEHSVLLTAIGRMFNYPTRVIIGIVVVKEKNGPQVFGHAWNEFFRDESWHRADATRVDQQAKGKIMYLPLSYLKDESPSYRMALLNNARMFIKDISTH